MPLVYVPKAFALPRPTHTRFSQSDTANAVPLYPTPC